MQCSRIESVSCLLYGVYQHSLAHNYITPISVSIFISYHSFLSLVLLPPPYKDPWHYIGCIIASKIILDALSILRSFITPEHSRVEYLWTGHCLAKDRVHPSWQVLNSKFFFSALILLKSLLSFLAHQPLLLGGIDMPKVDPEQPHLQFNHFFWE